MNLVREDESWVKLADLDAWAYFEFNDARFVLKVMNDGEPPETIQHWIRAFRRRVAGWEKKGLPPMKIPRSRRGQYLSVVRWNFDLRDPDQVADQVRKILLQFGRAGVLGEDL